MDRLKISNGIELFRVPFNDIAYIEAQGNYSVIHLVNGNTHTFTLQINKFEVELCNNERYGFVRLGRSFIVNSKYVLNINVRDRKLLLGSSRFSAELNVRRKSNPLEPGADSLPPKDALRELINMFKKDAEGGNNER